LSFCVSGPVPVQVPFWHESLDVQALLSLHDVPFVAFGVEQTPVEVLHVPAVWHSAGVGHTTGFDPVQVPLWHVSVCVHALPSEHCVPFAAFVGDEHVPVDGWHVPATLHVAAAGHTTGFDPTQLPLMHLSVCVHMSPSEQLDPSVAFVAAEQTPVVVLHVPATLHVAAAGHTTGFAPTQLPLWHVSVCVHALPSEQFEPFAAFVAAEHVPVDGWHVPATLHVAAAGHVTGFDPTHAPLMHLSVCVHMSPSEHVEPSVALVAVEQTPVVVLHVPATLHVPAVQVVVGPGAQAPLWQVSPTVQALLSVHVVPFVAAAHAPVAVTHTEQVPQTVPLF